MAAFFAVGMRGELVAKLQRSLARPDDGGPFYEGKIDSDFGAGVEAAVRRRQRALGRPATGLVDARLWHDITSTTWPDTFERHLNLLAFFEGHGYTKAIPEQPKETHVGLTWGIVGFTFFTKDGSTPPKPVKGSLQPVLRDAIAAAPDAALSCFGEERLTWLQEVLALAAVGEQVKRIATLVDGTQLKPAWRDAFHDFGTVAAVQQVQREAARLKYYVPALASAAEFGLANDQGQAFFFDVQVNNGGMAKYRDDARQAVDALGPSATDSEKLRAITAVLLRRIAKKFSPIIEMRKGTLADGFGVVNGHALRLDGWGLALPEPVALRVGALTLDDNALGEQQAFVDGAVARGLVLPQHAATRRKALLAFGRRTDASAFGEPGLHSLHLGGLAGPVGRELVAQSRQKFNHALDLLVGEPVGALVLSGDHHFHKASNSRSLFWRRGAAPNTGAGFGLYDADELRLYCGGGDVGSARFFDVTRWREPLSHCQLVIVLGSNGVPQCKADDAWFRDFGIAWRNWLGIRGHKPLVLGWYGHVRLHGQVPADAACKRFVAALPAGVPLAELCQQQPQQLIQAWGKACHDSFAATHPGLWQQRLLPRLEESHSGAGAIAPDGGVWRANPEYQPATPGSQAMYKEGDV